MKRVKKSKWNPFLEEGIRKFADFMNGGSKEAEQIKEEMQRTVDEEKRDMIEQYKFNKFMYEDLFGGDIEEDEDFDDIQF